MLKRIRYDYCKRCKKQPKSFSDFIRIRAQVNFHRTIIRPKIIWWQEVNQLLFLTKKNKTL
jgi:NAD-dependent SIR2 family protein deacetylase